ncbi:hypothetical protein GCM10011322_31640 [Salinarimonas ramus]|uniref:Uncharacterized protein n=1 Tax=Salinarimonas ramus TaxID=690164 RepID=A0A917QBT7_9HYPH|nr:hypothetical protein GCM10011322_31640 [Salinarimonas ramus]
MAATAAAAAAADVAGSDPGGGGGWPPRFRFGYHRERGPRGPRSLCFRRPGKLLTRRAGALIEVTCDDEET